MEIGAHTFRKIKECPRCTVPGRNQTTGEFHFKGGEYEGVAGKLLTPQNTLSKMFPAKAADDEWASWKGPVFGVYVSPNVETTATGSLRVGDVVKVTKARAGGGPSWEAFVAVALLVLFCAWFVGRI